MSTHTLLLVRHAQTVDSTAGMNDRDRPLTERGRQQASRVGAALRERTVGVDLVLCSSADRTRQTWDRLDLGCPVEFTDEIYNAGSDTLLQLLRLQDESTGSAMIIGHAPGLPALAAELTGPGSDPVAADTIASRYPTATLSRFAVDTGWADLQTARLDWVWLDA